MFSKATFKIEFMQRGRTKKRGHTLLVEELPGIFALGKNVTRNGTQEFNDMCKMVFIPRILFTGVWVEEVVTSRQLERLEKNINKDMLFINNSLEVHSNSRKVLATRKKLYVKFID